jgi:predicted deacylase
VGPGPLAREVQRVRDSLRIGSAEAQSGTKAQGHLHIAYHADGHPIQMPVIVVNGKRDGPVLSVVAGVHGDEYDSMIAASRFANELDPQELKGAVIDIPIVNTPAFDASSRVSPIDNLNLNRIFPGKKDGFISERIAYTLTNEVICKSQCFIDMHGGGNVLGIGPLASLEGEGEEAMMLAKAWGLELIWKAAPGKGFSTATALEMGVRASLAEIGGGSRYSEDSVNTFLSGLQNITKYLGLIEGEPRFRKKYILGDGDFISCNSGGFYIAERRVRDIVKKGDMIGKIYDIFGKETETVSTPIDGVILSIRTYPRVNPGDWVFCIGKATEI